jgi:exodeoxyribonuclease X
MKPNVKILDVESTDNDPATCELIEAAWYPNSFDYIGDPLDEYNINFVSYAERFWPSKEIKFGAMATHHIHKIDLLGCRKSSEFVAPDADYYVGHNIDFDWQIMGSPDVKRICTLALSRFLLPELDSHRQDALIYYFADQWQEHDRIVSARHDLRHAHEAAADVRFCMRNLSDLLHLASAKGHDVSTWEKVWELSEIARVPVVMGFGKHKGTPIADVDPGYVRWYRRQDETDPMYLKAFDMAGF